jgi:multiple sugar transport system substrate-binding protein
MKKQLYVLVALLAVFAMVLTACGNAATPTTAPVATAAPATAVPEPTGPVLIRWSIGIGTGADPAQVTIENEVADDFNKSQDKIHLIIEVIPNASARDTIATEIAAGAGPDIVGPVGWVGSNAFAGQWLDIGPYIASSGYDTSKFEAALVNSYQTEEGMVGLPFAVYPSALYVNTGLFTEAGLELPPAKYGDQYKMPDGSMVDWNWDALTKVAKLLTIDSAGKHSGEAGFDVTKAVQFGFTFQWEGHAEYWGTFMSTGGQLLVPGGSKGSYAAKAPEAWKTAWKWVYDGMWGAEPFIPTGAVEGSADFNSGNSFASGKIAIADMPSWYLCCIGDLVKAGGKFDFGAMPIALNDSKPAGRTDADTFRIWKGTKHPAEAFTVLAYLIDTGIQKLVVGTPERAPAYGAIPSQSALRGPWLTAQKAAWPFVKNWDVLIAGLNYGDVPSAEAFQPNMNESWARTGTFTSLMQNTKDLDLDAEVATLEKDLTAIYNK